MNIRCLLLLSLLSLPLSAQTYTPKSVVIDGPVDKSEALRIANISSGTVTKEQIEAALGRLADTGMYADLSYKVNGVALTIVLTPSAAAQLEPVVFSNFAWWKTDELESLVEARVPGYHGKLAAAGTMTQQVEDALMQLLQAKGIDGAKLDARESRRAIGSTNGAATTISITSPSIAVGNFDLQHGLPALEKNIANFGVALRGEDLDTGETTKSIQDSVNDMYQNAGYLDVQTSAAKFGEPQRATNGYTVNVTASVTPGEMYHVEAIDITPAPPVSLGDLTKASEIKAGDHASPAALRLAQGEMRAVYANAAYMDAQAIVATAKDSAAHTVTYKFNFEPGQLYHFADLDVSALTPEQQAAFRKSFHVAVGALADKKLDDGIRQAAMAAHVGLASMNLKVNRTEHTVIVAIKPGGMRP